MIRGSIVRMTRGLAGALLAAAVLAPPAVAQHEPHGPGGHEGHRVAPDAELSVADDPDAGVLTVRLGPLDLPARSDHHAAAQPPDRFLEIPFHGWLTAYAPRLVDGAGGEVPGRLLHHVAFWNASRSDFLCPNKEEHIFGAGGELNEWIPVPGFGYRVGPDDRIRIEAMFHNPTDRDHPATYLEVEVRYRKADAGEPLRSVYPVWIDVQECGPSDYDLPPGESVRTGEVRVPLAGRLLGVGGHLHDHGERLRLESLTRGVEIAELEPELDAAGRIVSMPIVPFFLEGGRPVGEGERLRVTAVYESPAEEALPGGAMGIVVGYFLPEEPGRMAAFRRHPER